MAKRKAIVGNNLRIVNTWLSTQLEAGEALKGTNEMTLAGSSEITVPQDVIQHAISMPLEAQVREVFQRAGANLFSGFTFSCMSDERVERHIRIEGLELLQSALSAGKGVIILLAHMGPWEALAQLPSFAARQGIEAPFGAMYRPLNNTYLDNWLKSQREAQGTRLFSRTGGFHKPVDFIRNGGMLGILADQKMREGPTTSYFGVEVASSPIPGLLHRRSGAPMLAISVATVAPMRWELTIAPVVVPADLDLKSREAVTRVSNQALEQRLARSPCDCLWMHKRF